MKQKKAQFDVWPLLILVGFIIMLVMVLFYINVLKSDFKIMGAGKSTVAVYELSLKKQLAEDFIAQALSAASREAIKEVYSRKLFECGVSVDGRGIFDIGSGQQALEKCISDSRNKIIALLDEETKKKLNEITKTYRDTVIPPMTVVYMSDINKITAYSEKDAIFFLDKSNWNDNLVEDSPPFLMSRLSATVDIPESYSSFEFAYELLKNEGKARELFDATKAYCEDDPFIKEAVIEDLYNSIVSCGKARVTEACECNTVFVSKTDKSPNDKIVIEKNDGGKYAIYLQPSGDRRMKLLLRETEVEKILFIKAGTADSEKYETEFKDTKIKIVNSADGSLVFFIDGSESERDINVEFARHYPSCAFSAGTANNFFFNISGRYLPQNEISLLEKYEDDIKITIFPGYSGEFMPRTVEFPDSLGRQRSYMAINLIMVKADNLESGISLKGYNALTGYEYIVDSELRSRRGNNLFSKHYDEGNLISPRSPLDIDVQTLFSIDFSYNPAEVLPFPQTSDFEKTNANIFVVNYPASIQEEGSVMPYDSFVRVLADEIIKIISEINPVETKQSVPVCINLPMTELLFNTEDNFYGIFDAYPKTAIPFAGFDWPINNVRQVTQCYGTVPPGYDFGYINNFHQGFDIVPPADKRVSLPDGGGFYRESVYSVFSGEVIKIVKCNSRECDGVDHKGYGEHVIIANKELGYVALYAHLDYLSIPSESTRAGFFKEGDFIPSGSRLGWVGNTGNSIAPHLHFEFYRYNDNIRSDPYNGFTRDRINPLCLLRRDAPNAFGERVDVSLLFPKDGFIEGVGMDPDNPVENVPAESFARNCYINYYNAYYSAGIGGDLCP